jgi:tetratricopeptide (TPR) repeat protein
MFKPKILASTLCTVFVASGCALQPKATSELRVEPQYRVQHSRMDADEAIARYRDSIRRDPLDVEAYNALGILLSSQGRFNEALRHFQSAVVLAPQRADLRNNLGYTYLLRGSSEEAVEALEEARRLDPAHQKALENLRIAEARRPRARSAPLPIQAWPLDESGAELVEVAPLVYELKAQAFRTPETPPVLAQAMARAQRVEAMLPAKASMPVGAPARKFRLEVSNGNGVNGLAKRVSDHLQGLATGTVRLTNQRPFEQAATEIQYRPGYEAEAQRLQEKLRHSVRAIPSEGLRSDIQVRLVLGKDAPSVSALLAPGMEPRPLLAHQTDRQPG